jgi:hypothetical protein
LGEREGEAEVAAVFLTTRLQKARPMLLDSRGSALEIEADAFVKNALSVFRRNVNSGVADGEPQGWMLRHINADAHRAAAWSKFNSVGNKIQEPAGAE